MYMNENGEYVVVRTYTNENGDNIKQTKTYQDNGYVRINEYYPDGTTTEEYISSEEEAEIN